LLWLLTLTSAQRTVDEVSFGHRIPFPGNRGAYQVPGWTFGGQNHIPQILSDRIILTPPVPGNTRGSMWANVPLSSPQWSIELSFRASGQEQGTGNLNLWYVKDKNSVGSNSAYTVEQFDGLVLVMDPYGGSGGKIRGFLNDGTVNFNKHSNPESLAFGHCDYSYRNLGRQSKLRIEHGGTTGFAVFIDGRECFKTEKVALPEGYTFGITAATGENPDSFEMNAFIATVGSGGQSPHQQQQQPITGGNNAKIDSFPGSPQALADSNAEGIVGATAQFTDLHNRIQGLSHQVANALLEISILGRKVDDKHEKVIQAVAAQGSAAQTGGNKMPDGLPDALGDLRRRLEGLERTLSQIQRDIGQTKDYGKSINDLRSAVEGIKGGIAEHLPGTLKDVITAALPNVRLLLLGVLAVQVTLAGGYVLYKRRRNNLPKKYL
ncbi:concanavalin A-like lectin/glucanase, partial [Piedraia hortae CBS 480.64]